MTDTEKAIREFKEYETAEWCTSHIPLTDSRLQAIQALQEKAEREKGCEWCDYFSKSKNLISNGNGQYEEIPHKYCGKCGKELVCE